VVHIDSTVAETFLEQIQTFSTSALAQFNLILPLALGVVITVTVVTMAVMWFKHLTGMGGH
jgi:hypothetical protein